MVEKIETNIDILILVLKTQKKRFAVLANGLLNMNFLHFSSTTCP